MEEGEDVELQQGEDIELRQGEDVELQEGEDAELQEGKDEDVVYSTKIVVAMMMLTSCKPIHLSST